MGDVISFLNLIQAIERLVTVCNWDHQGRLPRSYFTITAAAVIIMSDALSMGSIGSFFLHFVTYNPLLVVWFFFINIQKMHHRGNLLPPPTTTTTADAFPPTYLQLLLTFQQGTSLSFSINHKKRQDKKRDSALAGISPATCVYNSVCCCFCMDIIEGLI